LKADRLILGFLVLFIGAVWLLVNMGIFPARIAFDLWRYWPVLLIIWGLLHIFGRGSSASGCIVGLIILFLLAALFFTVLMPYRWMPAHDVSEIRYNVPGGEMITGVELDLVQHAGELSLRGLSDFRQSVPMGTDLLQALIQSDIKPRTTHSVSGGKTSISLKDSERPFNLSKQLSRWELWLNEEVPAEISLRTGAARAELDLYNLDVTRMQLKAGAGDITIHLGTRESDIKVESGAGNLTIYVPERTGIRLEAKGGLISVNGDAAGILKKGERNYESARLDEKDAIVQLDVVMGAGSITFKPATRKSNQL
jgi:hypothetical protein